MFLCRQRRADPVRTRRVGLEAISASSGVSGVLAPFIGEIGYVRALRGEVTDALHLDANYVRRTDAEVKWRACLTWTDASENGVKSKDRSARHDPGDGSGGRGGHRRRSCGQLGALRIGPPERSCCSPSAARASGLREEEARSSGSRPRARWRMKSEILDFGRSAVVAKEGRGPQPDGRGHCRRPVKRARGRYFWRCASRIAGARAFYAALGFVETGRRRSYYRDPAEDALVLSRPVPSDDEARL